MITSKGSPTNFSILYYPQLLIMRKEKLSLVTVGVKENVDLLGSGGRERGGGVGDYEKLSCNY